MKHIKYYNQKMNESTSDGVKLMCCKVSQNPHREEMFTEIPEKVFEIDGYQVADTILEGIPFLIYFDDNGNITNVTVDDGYKKQFEDTYNSTKWYEVVKKYATKILETGDEVDVPDFIKYKYFINGINVAYITNKKNKK